MKSKVILLGYILLARLFVAQDISLEDTSFHDLGAIHDILEKSRIRYILHDTDNVCSSMLFDTIIINEIFYASQYRLIHVNDSSQNLEFMKLTGKALEVMDRAEDAMQKGEFADARREYFKVFDLDSSYIKVITLIGHTYALDGDTAVAIITLKKAISLNPIDYQAYWWLGDIYASLGDYDQAKDLLTYAFMLNKNNPFLLFSLKKLLERKNVKIRENRLLVPVRISALNDTMVDIAFQKGDGKDWYGYALTRACWEYEPEFRDLINSDDFINQKMYRECLINQTIATEIQKSVGDELSSHARYLHDAIVAGYLDVILYWEIAGSMRSEPVLMLPEKIKDRIIEYIKKYVYCTEL